ncbi:MAG: hypothetical protein ACK4VN_04810 [Bacteroidales bacterium]
MKTNNKFLFVLILFLFSGCYANIKSRKAPDFNSEITKFYAVLKLGDNIGRFGPRFSRSLQELMLLRGVELEYEILDPLALETEQEVLNRIRKSNADGVMFITQTASSVTYSSNSISLMKRNATGGTFDVKVFVPGRENPVWRGVLKTGTNGNGDLTVVAKRSARRLCNQLAQDRLI